MTNPRRTMLSRYGFAAVGLAIAAIVRFALDPILGNNLPMLTFLIALAIVAAIEGFGPAMLVLFGTLAVFPLLFQQPKHSVGLPALRGFQLLGGFVSIGTIVALMCEALHEARRRAEDGQEELRREVARRVEIEAELRTRETRWRKLIENNTDVVVMLDRDGTILYASSTITGRSPEELVGTKGFGRVHPEDVDRVREALARVDSQPGARAEVEGRVLHQDGTWRKVHAVVVNHRDEPEIGALVANLRDITEEAALRDQVAESEGRFHAFMDRSPAIAYLKDEGGRYVWGNLAWAAQFGRPAAELIGLDDAALWPGAVADAFRASDRLAVESGRPIEIEEATGGRNYFSLKFPLEHGGARYVGGKTFDVTERVRDRDALRRSESLLQALADSMPQIVWTSDAQGKTLYMNKRWYEFTGFPEGDAIDQEGSRSIFHPDDWPRCQRVWAESQVTGEPFQMEYRFHDRRTGQYRWFLGRSVPVRDASGRIERWYGTSTDIDDQKRAEGAAEAANQAKDRFLAILSHELRTPLTPILLSVSTMLNDATIDDDLRGSLEMIRRNVSLESRLIDDLLDLTRIARGSFALQTEPCDVHALIASSLEICGDDFRASELAIRLDLKAPAHTVQADAARLQQVFWNLFKNAVKFSPRGATLSIRSHADEATGCLVVEVQDGGIGIDPQFLPRMFEAFEQGETSPWARKYGGLGLGLAISRSIVEAHKGRLQAASEGRDKGSTFLVELPLVPADQIRPPSPHGVPPASREGRPLHILLIEDDPTTLSVLARLLKIDRHAVTTATSVSSAISAAEGASAAFDLIISDIGLPDGNGIDLMRTLQARQPTPAIALTGFGMEDDIRKGEDVGFGAHLTKPIDFRTLEETIRKVIGQDAGEPNARAR